MAAAAAATQPGRVLAALARTALLLSLAVALLSAEKKPRPKPKPLISLQRTKLLPKVYDLEHCADKDHSIRILNMTHSMGPLGVDVFDLEFEFLRGARLISEIRTMVQRCTGAVSSNMCEKFDTLSFTTAVCEVLKSKALPFSQYIELVEPPLKCPVQAGVYVLRNASLDLDKVDKTIPGLNMDKYIWLAEVHVYDEKRALYACFKWVTEAKRIRVKDEGLFG